MSLWQNAGQSERLVLLKMVRIVAHGQVVMEKQAAKLDALTR
jgi:hypothetical protein